MRVDVKQPQPLPTYLSEFYIPQAQILHSRIISRSYMKKLTEECCGCEEGIRLLQFLCWEHAGWSRIALAELLWQMAYAYCHELRRHSDALTALLLMEDSWQQHRIHNVIKVTYFKCYFIVNTFARILYLINV